MIDFPSPTLPREDRAAVFGSYLDFYRATVIDKVAGLSPEQAATSVLPSGWTPAQLLLHLTFVERRWVVWGFLGEDIGDPWGDEVEGVWSAEAPFMELIAGLRAQGEVTRSVLASYPLEAVGQPSPRWDGADPPTLERVCFHLLQEYARHTGHLDVVRELIDGRTGE